MNRLRSRTSILFLVAFFVASAACNAIIGLDPGELVESAPSTATGTSTGKGGTTSSAGGIAEGGGGAATTGTSGTAHGGNGSSSGPGGAGAAGGSGNGGFGGGCTSPADCPPPATECLSATCVSGSCGVKPVSSGTLTS